MFCPAVSFAWAVAWSSAFSCSSCATRRSDLYFSASSWSFAASSGFRPLIESITCETPSRRFPAPPDSRPVTSDAMIPPLRDGDRLSDRFLHSFDYSLELRPPIESAVHSPPDELPLPRVRELRDVMIAEEHREDFRRDRGIK